MRGGISVDSPGLGSGVPHLCGNPQCLLSQHVDLGVWRTLGRLAVPLRVPLDHEKAHMPGHGDVTDRPRYAEEKYYDMRSHDGKNPWSLSGTAWAPLDHATLAPLDR